MLSSWKKCRLGELVEVVMGQSPPGETCNSDEKGFPLLNGPTEFGASYPIPVQFTSSPKKMASEFDILFCVRGSTTGRMNWADKTYAIGRGLAGIRHKKGSDYRHYLKGLIDCHLPSLLMSATGSTFPNVSRDQILEIKIDLPPLAEQKAIAEVLSALDDKIELNRQMNETLEGIAQALFKSWFIDFEPVKAKMAGRQPEGLSPEIAALFPDKLVDSPLGMIPEGWEVVRINDIVKLSIGRTPPRLEKHWFSMDHSGVKWISIKDLGCSKTFISESSERLSDESIKKFRIPIIKKGTVVVSFKLTVGRTAIVCEEMCSNEAIAQFPLTTEKIGNYYLYFWLNGYDYNQLGNTSSIANAVNSKILREIRVIVPDYLVHSSFHRIVKPLFERIELNVLVNKALTKIRDALLPKLISGELRVADSTSLIKGVI